MWAIWKTVPMTLLVVTVSVSMARGVTAWGGGDKVVVWRMVAGGLME